MSGFRAEPAYSPEIEAGLRRIRGRRRAYWVAFFSWLPAGLLVRLATFWFDPEANVVSFFGLGYFAMLMVLAIRMQRSKCPRCGRTFAAKWYWANPWAQSCLHCHLGMDGMPKATGKSLASPSSPEKDRV